MTERSRFWNGAADGSGTGDASEASYDAHNEFAQVMGTVSGGAARANKGGVSFGERSNYAATVVGGAVRVQPGTGMCDGTWHDSDANVDLTISTPAGATRVDVIVLKKDEAAQTVRIANHAGAEGGGVPTLTQGASVWEIPLWNASITTGGAITLTDRRQGLAGDVGGSLPTTIELGDAGTAGAVGIPADSGHEHPFPAPNSVAAILFDGASNIDAANIQPAAEGHVHETPKIFRKKKSSDETLGNSTVLQDDNDLTFPVVSGENYIFHGTIFYNGGVDFKLAFNAPGGSSLRWGAFGPGLAFAGGAGPIVSFLSGSTNGVDTGLTWGSTGGLAEVCTLQFSGGFTAGANGTFVCRWAKATADLDITTVYRHSNLIGMEV